MNQLERFYTSACKEYKRQPIPQFLDLISRMTPDSTHLNLSSFERVIGAAAIKPIASTIEHISQLSHLSISNQAITDSGFNSVVRALERGRISLVHLDVRNCLLTSSGMHMAFNSVLPAPFLTLQSLDISHNTRITDKGFVAVVSSFQQSKDIRRMVIEQCGLTTKSLPLISRLIARNGASGGQLTELVLTNNNIGPHQRQPQQLAEWLGLCRVLSSNPPLRSLGLRKCGLGQVSGRELVKIFPANTSLAHIDIRFNRISSIIQRAVLTSARRNAGYSSTPPTPKAQPQAQPQSQPQAQAQRGAPADETEASPVMSRHTTVDTHGSAMGPAVRLSHLRIDTHSPEQQHTRSSTTALSAPSLTHDTPAPADLSDPAALAAEMAFCRPLALRASQLPQQGPRPDPAVLLHSLEALAAAMEDAESRLAAAKERRSVAESRRLASLSAAQEKEEARRELGGQLMVLGESAARLGSQLESIESSNRALRADLASRVEGTGRQRALRSELQRVRDEHRDLSSEYLKLTDEGRRLRLALKVVRRQVNK
eukprot:gnl/Dysnectes_brevis/5073_a7140_485.p1 GENE.gnl/Dysnectes_brevis/5073_a7140_485~~gnl/Dysnectes_brevis/5073_a7140_485.p1  ORF type:complete len:541 (+),score=86.45 gnl/Dysnectes_brevis/5073_a7140_485:335-1957(+)